mgnify:CR=1 FL=1
MKTIEIRRHSIRNKPGAHLSQQGVTLARLVGQNLGNKAYRVTGYDFPPPIGIRTGFYGAPRTVSLSLAYSF